MSIISKKNKKQASTPEQTKEDATQMLTPWQKENLKYHEQHGEKPNWELEPSMIHEEDTIEPFLKEISEETDIPQLDEEETKKIKELPRSKSFADKLPKMKKERQKRLKRRLITIVGVFGTAALGMIYYVSPLSKLGDVHVENNKKVAKEDIIHSSQLVPKDFLWPQVINETIEEKIMKKNPQVKSVKVSLTKFNDIKLTVKEYKMVAYHRKEDTLYPILENGTILEEPVTKFNAQYLVLYEFPEGDALQEILEASKYFDKNIKKNIVQIQLTPKENNHYMIRITMADGNQIIGSTTDIKDKINYYPQAAAGLEEPGIVDMEAGVFSKTYSTIAKEEEEKAKILELKRINEENERDEEIN